MGELSGDQPGAHGGEPGMELCPEPRLGVSQNMVPWHSLGNRDGVGKGVTEKARAPQPLQVRSGKN